MLDKGKPEQQKTSAGEGSQIQISKLFDKFARAKGKFSDPRAVIIILLSIYLGSSMFYTVGVDEVGIVQRFGRHVRTEPPGLNFKLPIGIEKATKVKVRFVYREEFGLKAGKMDEGASIASMGAHSPESLMLTGDLNVAVVPWVVHYRIKDPYNFLFRIKDPQVTLRDLSEATVRLVVGDRSLNEVITRREEIALQAQDLLQKELDEAETGISVTSIELKKTNVPEQVQPSFNEVNQATQEKEKLIYQAREEYNKRIPQARGEAEKTVREAEGYALDRVNKAQGDGARFTALYAEYAKAEDVTRRRLYLEAIREILPKMGDKYIVDHEQENPLPLLNLGESDDGMLLMEKD